MRALAFGSLALSLLAIIPSAARASGGPQNLLVVVNENSQDSLEVANYLRLKRNVPSACFCRIRVAEKHDIAKDEFETAMLNPVLAYIKEAGLEDTVKVIVFTKGMPYRVNWAPRLRVSVCTPASAGTMDIGPMAKQPYYYADKPFFGLPRMPYLSLCLTGFTVDDVKRCIDQGVASDGTFPRGTIYLFDGVGPRARVAPRYGRDECIEGLKKLGIKYEVRPKHSLTKEQDVLGYWTGFTRVNVKNIGFLPGALADHLTSFGGILFNNKSQMSILHFIAAGATGSYGTVTEPTNIHTRHSHGWLFLRYVKGLSLAEAYWTSVQDVTLGVFVGEPLATPFARRPVVRIDGPEKPVKGTARIRITARPQTGGASSLRRVTWWIDGRPFGPAANPAALQGASVSLTVKGATFAAKLDGSPADLLASLAAQVNDSVALSGDDGVRCRVRGSTLLLQARKEGDQANDTPFSLTVREGKAEGAELVVKPATGTLSGGAATERHRARLSLLVNARKLQTGDGLTIETEGKSFSASVGAADAENPLLALAKQLVAPLRSSRLFHDVKAGMGRNLLQIVLLSRKEAEAGNGQKVRITVKKRKDSKFSVFPAGERSLSGGRTDRHFAEAVVDVYTVLSALVDSEVELDTRTLGDGHHRLLLVAEESGSLRTQGWATAELRVANGRGRLKLLPPKDGLAAREPSTFRARFYGSYPAGLGRMVLLVDGREAAVFDKRKRICTLDPAKSGVGPGPHDFQVRVEPKKPTGKPLTSDPVTLTVTR